MSGADLAIHIAAGLITSLVTNFSCIITQIHPPLGYIVMGVLALIVGIIAVANFAEGNTAMGLAQIANLVSIVFSMFNPTCFTGDTEVYTDSGLVCIEDVQVGDEVWAYNSETGETELKEVLNVWIKETDEILHVEASDGETIDTTTNHPFYVEEKGWVAAGDLEVGDVLYTADGDEVKVTDLELEKLAEPITVYNLEVEDFHTYFVGEYGILVHNYTKTENVDDFDIVDYADKHSGYENHHGILDVWASNNIPGYKSRASNSTSMAMTAGKDGQHAATKEAYREWLTEMTGLPVGGKVDWTNVSPREIQALAERMFDPAGVPHSARSNYYREFMRFIYSL